MMLARIAGFVVAVITAVAPIAAAQHEHEHQSPPDSISAEVLAFLAEVRATAEQYHDPAAASLAGYRLLGPDFPGMGYHWVNGELAARREIDPRHPPVISYLDVDGSLLLTGVAFAMPVRAGEPLPDFPYPGAWHVHSGTVEEETLFLNPASMSHSSEGEWRLAMLHAWVITENPAGVFEQDNWALPYLRVGLKPPADVSPQAAKALHLIAGGENYYLKLIEAAASIDKDERRRVAQLLRTHADQVRAFVAMASETPDHSQMRMSLERVWREMWQDIRAVLRETTWNRVSMLAG